MACSSRWVYAVPCLDVQFVESVLPFDGRVSPAVDVTDHLSFFWSNYFMSIDLNRRRFLWKVSKLCIYDSHDISLADSQRDAGICRLLDLVSRIPHCTARKLKHVEKSCRKSPTNHLHFMTTLLKLCVGFSANIFRFHEALYFVFQSLNSLGPLLALVQPCLVSGLSLSASCCKTRKCSKHVR